MPTNRRDFLQNSLLAALGASLSGKTTLSDINYGKKLDSFGLQLWSVRHEMEKNARETLKQIAAFGYKQIESFEGSKDMFWGMSNKGFKKYMNELGMNIVSSHSSFTADFERKVEAAAEIGMKYLVCPHKGAQQSIDDYKRIADEFNHCGEICKKNGLRYAYHNHAYSFQPIDGQLPQDILMNNTDKDLMDFQMDIYWVVAAGEDPILWLNKYPGRFKLCHIKDYKQNTSAPDGYESVQLGKGIIDFHSILQKARKNGMQYYFAEQETFTNSSPLESAKVNAAYLKAFRF